jgi:hypothetical protein
MSAKYYTHFIAQSEGAAEYNEYRGVVELVDRSSKVEGDRAIARMLARRSRGKRYSSIAMGPFALASMSSIP